MRWIDIPPVWLAAFAALAWAQATFLPMGLGFGGAWADFAGGILVGGGLVVIVLAAIEMRRHRTTIIPHMDADRLVTTGVFARSRNPIYLADSMILFGLILRWDAVLALPLLPVFVWVIERRFVLPEEARLKAKFLAVFERYAQQTNRWL
ncbi:isoprenylcysteine carboxylmethyltransferase family protein [Thalassococcus profundi]|uniref:Isoprenylcysteine carboxylmethyltransferase family protein n=1 Tax=Thalassococcus profundi TaxID=2282382 RepID=A0A369TPG4_9RHOB|nr:methyltransferase [Thalassococcus profundi]RDD67060.1 isoprenylcysteine carboxylmethyltransferase family protein [Thalassococcus profundi]